MRREEVRKALARQHSGSVYGIGADPGSPSTRRRNHRTLVGWTDQDDEADGLAAANDSDGDHVVIRTNGTALDVEAFEGGQPRFWPLGRRYASWVEKSR
jgi:hypothetical protein